MFYPLMSIKCIAEQFQQRHRVGILGGSNSSLSLGLIQQNQQNVPSTRFNVSLFTCHRSYLSDPVHDHLVGRLAHTTFDDTPGRSH